MPAQKIVTRPHRQPHQPVFERGLAAKGGQLLERLHPNFLDDILDLAFPEFRTEGGTMIIPGHGRVSDSADVAYYRDMVTIIRDRVQVMIKKGMTLDQVKAAKPTLDYDTRYDTPAWTKDMFVTAVYQSLSKK